MYKVIEGSGALMQKKKKKLPLLDLRVMLAFSLSSN